METSTLSKIRERHHMPPISALAITTLKTLFSMIYGQFEVDPAHSASDPNYYTRKKAKKYFGDTQKQRMRAT